MDKPIIFHIDMNSYFASVEQQANPFLRGKPVGVCAYLSKNGCIIASSIEAKKLGIKTGMAVWQGKAIYPDVILVQNNPAKYRSVTNQFFSILSEYTDKIEPYSIDEAFLDLTGWSKDFTSGYKIAFEIQKRIKNEVGDWLRSSIGLAPTRFLAKLASDITDPDSILVLTLDRLDEFYKDLKLTDVWGINKRLERRLNKIGVRSVIELKNFPVVNLMQAMGKYGYYLRQNLNGIEISGVQGQQIPKSIGHSYCIPVKTNDISYLKKIFMKLCEKTGRRLRQLNLEADSIFVYWGYVSNGRQMKLHRSISDSLLIYKKVMEIFQQFFNGEKVLMLAVGVGSLHPKIYQLSFFEEKKLDGRIQKAVDEVNDKFGEFTVFRGAMWETDKNAPDRIGFRKSMEPAFLGKGELEYNFKESH